MDDDQLNDSGVIDPGMIEDALPDVGVLPTDDLDGELDDGLEKKEEEEDGDGPDDWKEEEF